VVRYDEHTHNRMKDVLLDKISSGLSLALVTDAGTPAVSDPGTRLVAEAVKKEIKVVPIPGPSAVTAAVSASGLGAGGFVFLGFLPRRKGLASRLLREAFGLGKTVVLLESPFRVEAVVDLVESLCPRAEVVVAREMTKIHEEITRGDIKEVGLILKNRTPRGEFVLLFQPPKEKKGTENQ